MPTVTEHIRQHFLASRLPPASKPVPSLASLRQTEWSPEFEQLMRNRLALGAIRYGLLHAPGKPIYDRLASIGTRLQAYAETGNDEHLVDIANMALLEYEEGIHPTKHFAALDDSEHTKAKTSPV